MSFYLSRCVQERLGRRLPLLLFTEMPRRRVFSESELPAYPVLGN
jgi:hypothetical protein